LKFINAITGEKMDKIAEAIGKLPKKLIDRIKGDANELTMRLAEILVARHMSEVVRHIVDEELAIQTVAALICDRNSDKMRMRN
jgi:hypothetical protein